MGGKVMQSATAVPTTPPVMMRDVVGNHIIDMGARFPLMAAVSADLNTSFRIKGFFDKYPERSYNIGIAEQNMISFAAGLAHEGFIPFAFTFAPFASLRATEQIRTDVCYSNLPVRIIGSMAGYAGGISGATHCALEDCAIATSFANMTVLEPCDAVEAVRLLDATMQWDGPVYMRFGRTAGSLYAQGTKFEIGKALVPVEGNDGAFIASGITVTFATEAAKMIKQETGANIRVVDMHTLKPLDTTAVLDAVRTGRVVCAQDHNIIGGLGYAVAAAIAQSGLTCKYTMLGCPDKFVPLATPDFLYRTNEYDAAGLCKHMKALLD
jgi:transketolase